MPRITIDLLRKRAEHNEGMISTLEEISLHQEELEKIELIGTLCRKLKILYLQNNIISKIEDLTHMKQLEYLNLALNNITKIEGLSNCEFLQKLDLTVNFIDFDTLEDSIEHLKPLQHLKELFFMGNPAKTEWDGFDDYVIASLPQLECLDGRDITRSQRIKAAQRTLELQRELRALAEQCVKRKLEALTDVIDVISGKATDISRDTEAIDDVDEDTSSNSNQKDDEKCAYTPESRREMYLELAEQKAEQERRRTENYPKERNYDIEHQEALQKARVKEQGAIRQCNEGKYEFRFDEVEVPGYVVLIVYTPRHLDSSLISIDAHPKHITVVIKNKVLRLKLPEECNSDAGKAERSKVSGELRVTLPKIDKEKGIEMALRTRHRLQQEQQKKEKEKIDAMEFRAKSRPKKLGEQIIEASRAVCIRGIVENEDSKGRTIPLLTEVSSSFKNEELAKKVKKSSLSPEDDDDIPPLY